MSNKSKILKPFGTKDGLVFRLGKSKELPEGKEIPLTIEETFDLIDDLRTAYETHFRMTFGERGREQALRDYMKHAERKENEKAIDRAELHTR